MRRKHIDLALRQQLLVLASAELRARASQDLSLLGPPLHFADRARDGWHWLKAHPEGPLLAVGVLALLRPRRAVRWSLKLWGAWRMWRKLRRVLVASGVFPLDPNPDAAPSRGGSPSPSPSRR